MDLFDRFLLFMSNLIDEMSWRRFWVCWFASRPSDSEKERRRMREQKGLM